MKYTLLFLFIFTYAYCSAQHILFDKAPAWVIPVEATLPNATQGLRTDVADGFYYSLIDRQSNPDEDALYSHSVINVVSYGGITNSSQVLINYDSSYQKVIVHHLFIWRKGKKIDRTGELSFEILRNENNLANGMYYGLSQAYDILNDVRKDDLIDFAYTLVGENPIYGNTEHELHSLQDMKPIDRLFLRIINHSNRELKYNCVNCDSLEVKSFAEGDNRVIEVTGINIEGVTVEDNLPPWVNPFAYLIVSAFNNWSDVNQWAQEVFKLDQEPVLDAVYEEILTGTESTEEKINKFIDYVQDEIRYMGVESGIGSIKPRRPELVVSQRFGDCKDKSLLLISLLKQAGVDKAWPVIVNTALQHETKNLLPGNRIFNHCIVKFEYHDSTFWVDPTVFLQGGTFRTLHTTDFGRVLVVGQPADTLDEMKPRQPESSITFNYTFDSPSFNEPVILTCVSIRKGEAADARRAMQTMIAVKDFSEEFVKELRNYHPSVELEKQPEITDDPVNNEFRITHHLKINEFWVNNASAGAGDKGSYTCIFEPMDVIQLLTPIKCTPRKHDVYLSEIFNMTCRYIFNCPKEIHYVDSWDLFESDAYTYEENFVQLSPKTVQAEYNYRSKVKYVTPEQFCKTCDVQNEIREKLKFAIIYPK